jgi:uncharacterized protein (TIGR00369 family)
MQLLQLNPEHLKAVIRAINKGPFFKHMSLRVTEIGVGYSVVVIEIGKKHMNPFGGLHGGAIASAIDTAAYWSAYCEIPEESGLVSIDLNVDFLAPVTGERIVINGQRIKSGKTIYLTVARMCDPHGRVLAHGTSKLMVTRDKQSIIDVVKYVGSNRLPQKFIELVSKPRITAEGKAQADSEAEHTVQYVSISRGLQRRHRLSDGVMKPVLKS